MRPTGRRTDGNSSAFTLSELLIVVGIIGVLAALALPALNTSFALAQSAQCKSHMKQWANATYLYATDNGGKLPPSAYNSTSPGYDASTYLISYLGINASEGNNATLFNKKYRCPVTYGTWGSYGFNGYFSTPPTLASIEGPDRLIWIMDNAAGCRWFNYAVIQGSNNYQLKTVVPKPHSRKINVAYMDGHVESMLVSQMTVADCTRYTPSYSAAHETQMVGTALYDK